MSLRPTRISKIFKQMAVSLSLFVGMACVSQLVHADLIKFDYTDKNSGASIIAKPGVEYISPSGSLNFMLAGGIDRKLRLTIIHNGKNLYTRQSAKLLGAANTIDFEGKTYYAEIFSIPALNDGAYQFKSEILSSTNTVISTKITDVVVDTTAPEPGDFVSRAASRYAETVHTGDLWKLGIGSGDGLLNSAFSLTGFSDSSGIKSIKAQVYRESGKLYREYDVQFSSEKNEGVIVYRTNFFPSSDLDEIFGVQFAVTDNAGNTSLTRRQHILFDNVGNEPRQPFAVFDPDATGSAGPGLSGFVPYQAGMFVKTNPIRLAYKVPKNNWHTFRSGGLRLYNSLGENKIAGQDSDNVYLIASLPYGSQNSDHFRFVNFGAWMGTGAISFNLKLHEDAPKSPVLKNVEYLFSDVGWHNYGNRTVPSSALPVQVTSVRFTAEPRPYVQRASHYASCDIPVGETQCVVSVNIPLNKGTTGYLHNMASLRSADGALSAKAQWAYVWWNDQYYPQINYEYNQQSMIMTLRVNQPGQGMHQQRLSHLDAWLENKEGTRLSVSKKRISAVDSLFVYEFDLKTLPEGVHELYAVANERISGSTRQYLFPHRSDRTAPTVKIINEGGQSLDTLDRLSFTVTDDKDENPLITSILLTGGPAKETISLPYRATGSETYGFEYPILFPSMTAGEDYKITVQAKDNQLNTGVGTISFTYTPLMVGVEDAEVRTPAISSRFDRNNGTPLINSEQLKLADGSPVSGTYDLIATLRSDAVTPFIISGVEIKPGETQMLGQLNFTSTKGRIDIAAIPVKQGAEGANGLIISTSAPNAPVVYTTIETWMPKSSLTVSDAEPTQSMTTVEARVTPSQSNACPLTSSGSVARSGDPVADPICLIEWTKVPHGMRTIDVEDSELPMTMLRGRPLVSGPQDIEYTISLYNRHGDKIRLTSVSKTINTKSPAESVRFGSSLEGHAITRVLDNPILTMEQKSGIACNITGSRSQARAIALAGGPLTCLIEFKSIPPELAVVSDEPLVRSGVFQRAGNFPLSWSASLFNGLGQEVMIEQGSSMIRVVHPTVYSSATFTVNESSSINLVSVEDNPEAWGEKTYSIDRHPLHGEVEATQQGFTYTPEQGYVGADSFTYQVTDESGMVAAGEASGTVEQFNYPPTSTRVLVQSREAEVSDLTSPIIDDINLWDNHTLTVLDQPSNGEITQTEGQFVLTPEPGFWGDDRFTYRVTDMAGESVDGVGTIYVSQFNVAPSLVRPGNISLYQGVSRAVALVVEDINIYDKHRLAVVSKPEHITARIDGSSLILYSSKTGSFQITVRATDQDGLYVDQTIELMVMSRPPSDNQIRSEAPISASQNPQR